VRDGREDSGVFVVDVDVCVADAVGGIWEGACELGGWVLAVEREVCGGGGCGCDCGCDCEVESSVLREGGEGGVLLCALLLPLLLLLRRRKGDVRCERETVIVLVDDPRG